MMLKSILLLLSLLLSGSELFAQTYYYAFGKKVLLEPLHEHRSLNNDTNITYYKTASGRKIGVKNEVIIGCKIFRECKPLLEKYPILSIKKLSDRLYLLKLQKDTDPFEIANALYHEEMIFLSHPNLVTQRRRR